MSNIDPIQDPATGAGSSLRTWAAWHGEKDPAFEWFDRCRVTHDAGLGTCLAALR